MLTRLFIIVLLVLLADLRLNAVTLKGVILENELSGPPMANVPVVADRANPTATDAMGEFTLDFPKRQPGETVNVKVQKEGWVVVNDIQLQLELPVRDNDKLLTVILSKAEDREEMARRFYRLTSDKAIELLYQQKVRALEDTNQATSAALTRLQQERDQAKAAAQKASEELAKAEPVQSAELYHKAKRLYLDGKSEEALAVLFRGEASVELFPATATPSVSQDYELQNIKIAKTLWENLGRFMRWDVFPRDYKALLETLAVNGAAESAKNSENVMARLPVFLMASRDCSKIRES